MLWVELRSPIPHSRVATGGGRSAIDRRTSRVEISGVQGFSPETVSAGWSRSNVLGNDQPASRLKTRRKLGGGGGVNRLSFHVPADGWVGLWPEGAITFCVDLWALGFAGWCFVGRVLAVGWWFFRGRSQGGDGDGSTGFGRT